MVSAPREPEIDRTAETSAAARAPIFSADFENVPAARIIDEVRRTGFWALEGALEKPFVDEMLGQIDFEKYLVNSNVAGVVCASDQRFLSHCLAASKNAYDVITSPEVRDICRAYFEGEPFRLTNQRIYQTHTGGHMPWHTDNNCQSGNALTGKHQLRGLLFLAYLSDVTVNPFQIVRNSHEWSKTHADNYFSDQWIEKNHGDDIATFRGPRGTLFVCDIHAIHRAEPFQRRGYERFTLLFQIDAVSPDYPDHGEKLLVNTAFVDRREPEVLDLLGFGQPASYPAFPCTSAANMSLRDLVKMQCEVLPLALRAAAKAIAKALIPGSLVVNLKRWKWRRRREAETTGAGATARYP